MSMPFGTPDPYQPQNAGTGAPPPYPPLPYGVDPFGVGYGVPPVPVKPVAPAVMTTIIWTHFVLGVIMVISSLFGAATPGVLGAGLPSMVLGFAAIGVGSALRWWPGSASRMLATVLSAFWCLSIIGIPIALPILLALWKSEDVVRYLDACERYRAIR